MSKPRPVYDLIARWPSRRVFAEEVGQKVDAVHKWAANDRIPTDRQASVVEAARRRGYDDITYEWIVKAHAPETPEGAAR